MAAVVKFNIDMMQEMVTSFNSDPKSQGTPGTLKKRRKSLDFLQGKGKNSGCDDSDFDDPPILSITIAGDNETIPARRRASQEDRRKEFAYEAAIAVQSQLDSRDLSCCHVPPSSMEPNEALDLFKKAKVSYIVTPFSPF